MKRIFHLTSSLLIFIFSLCEPSLAKTKLTISGISSGGFMAAQMAVIYSDQFSGVATVAGGVYYCAQNTFQENINKYGVRALLNFGVSATNLLDNSVGPMPTNPLYQALGVCMAHPERSHGSEKINPQRRTPMSLDFLKPLQEQKLIAPLLNIAQQRVLIYQGEEDNVVRPAMADKLQEFYGRLGVDRKAIKVLKAKGAAHNFPTDRTDGIDCNTEKVPYLANCQRDLAGEILNHVVRRPLNRVQADPAHLYQVRQPAAPSSVASYGYLYANDYCLRNPNQCDLHVALHGCKMSDSYDEAFQKLYEAKIQRTNLLTLQDYEMRMSSPRMGARKFAQYAGYAEYAEASANRLMVYFPQTQITRDNYPENPKGCWDWYGWTGEYYATNRGIETSWLMAQIRKVREKPTSLILKSKRPWQ